MRSLDEISALIVDDNIFVRKLMKSMLRQISVAQIDECDDGQAAFQFLTAKPVDIVLLDWVMPGWHGARFLKNLMARAALAGTITPPVLVVTANASRAVVLEAARLGADGVVAKPFSVSILKSRIFDVINKEALQASIYQEMLGRIVPVDIFDLSDNGNSILI